MQNDKEYRGAIYYRLVYPGHLRLRAGATFQVPYESSLAGVYLKTHLTSVSILSHWNFLDYVADGTRRHLRLRRPIDVMPKETISSEFRMQVSEVSQKTLCTKDRHYTTYAEKPYTEIIVGVEREGLTDESRPEMGELIAVLSSFLELYRAMSGDLTVRRLEDLSVEVPVVWVEFAKYPSAWGGIQTIDRINRGWPSEFRPWHFDVVQHGGSGIESDYSYVDFSTKFANYLISGARVPSSLSAVMRCAQLTDRSREHKWVVMEVFTIAELVWNEYFSKLGSVCETSRNCIDKKKYRGRVRAQDAVNSLLPRLLDGIEYKEGLIRDLDIVRKLRDRIVHHGESATAQEAQTAINATRSLITSVGKSLDGYGLSLK